MLLNKTKKLYAVLFFSAFSFTIYSAENEAVILKFKAQSATLRLFESISALSLDDVKPIYLKGADTECPVKVMIGSHEISFPVGRFQKGGYPEAVKLHPDFALFAAVIGDKDKDQKLREVKLAIDRGADPRLELSMKLPKVANPIEDCTFSHTPVFEYLDETQDAQFFKQVLTSSRPMPLDFAVSSVNNIWELPKTLDMLSTLVLESEKQKFTLPPDVKKCILDYIAHSHRHSADVFEAFLVLPGWLNTERKKYLLKYLVCSLDSECDSQGCSVEKMKFWCERLQRLLKHVDSSDLLLDSLTKSKDCLTRVEHRLTQQGL